MLTKIMEEELRNRQLSVRAAAREIGIAHTTLNRILSGDNVDRSTIEKVSTWIGVSISTLLGFSESKTASAVSALLEKDPEMEKVIIEINEALKEGILCQSDMKDIISYAEFKLEAAKKRFNQKEV